MYARIPEHIVQQIKDGLSIVQVIGQYVELKRAGRTWKGLCPFHGENAPSFSVSEEEGFFYCFGCQAHGDVIHFLEMIENLTFPEALERSAQMAGIELPQMQQLSPAERKKLSDKERMFQLNRDVREYYQSMLISHEQSKRAMQYIERREISREMTSLFQLGFAPDGWDNLVNHARKQRWSERDLEALGLIVRGKRGGYYDRFRNRLMFPIVMQHDHVIGFGGRTLGEEQEAKYINSPESPLYSKSDSLFGYHAARAEISRNDIAIIVEGNIDVVKMHQHGFGNTIAALGTALTESQIRFIKRMTSNMVIIYDGDNAGQKAMFKALDLFLKAGVNARGALLPAKHDPDSFLVEHGSDEMRKLVDEAPYLFDLWLEERISSKQPGPRGTSECLRTIIPMLNKIADNIERSLYVQKIAGRLDVREQMVMQLLRQHVAKKNWERLPVEAAIRNGKGNSADTTLSAAEEELFSLLMHYPDIVAQWFSHDEVTEKMTSPVVKTMTSLILGNVEKGKKISMESMLDLIEEKKEKNKFVNLLLNKRELDEDVIERSYKDCLAALNARSLEDEIDRLKLLINTDSDLDEDQKLELANRQLQLRQKLHAARSDVSNH